MYSVNICHARFNNLRRGLKKSSSLHSVIAVASPVFLRIGPCPLLDFLRASMSSTRSFSSHFHVICHTPHCTSGTVRMQLSTWGWIPGGLDLWCRTLWEYFPRKWILLMFLGERLGRGSVQYEPHCVFVIASHRIPTYPYLPPNPHRDGVRHIALCLNYTRCFDFHHSVTPLEHADSQLPTQRALYIFITGWLRAALTSWHQAPGIFACSLLTQWDSTFPTRGGPLEQPVLLHQTVKGSGDSLAQPGHGLPPLSLEISRDPLAGLCMFWRQGGTGQSPAYTERCIPCARSLLSECFVDE